MSQIASVVTRVDKALQYVAMLATGVLVLGIVAEVVARYVFSQPIVGSYEFLQTYVLAAVIFLGMGWTLREGGHVRITLVTRRLRGKPLTVVTWIAALLTAATSALLAAGTISATLSTLASAETSVGVLRLPMWIGQLFPAIGFTSMTALLVLQLFLIPSGTSIFQRGEEEDADASI